jgi:hypothetical protein
MGEREQASTQMQQSSRAAGQCGEEAACARHSRRPAQRAHSRARRPVVLNPPERDEAWAQRPARHTPVPDTRDGLTESPDASPTTAPHPCHAPTLQPVVKANAHHRSALSRCDNRCRAVRNNPLCTHAHALSSMGSAGLDCQWPPVTTTTPWPSCASAPVAMGTSVDSKPYRVPVRRLMLQTRADPSRRRTLH